MTAVRSNPDSLARVSVKDELEVESTGKMSPRPFIFVPIPGDHYTPLNGSAIMTLVYEFTRKHVEAGGHSRIIIGRNAMHDYDAGECVKVDFGPLPSRNQKIVDIAAGRLGMERPNINRVYSPALGAVEKNFDGTIFIQNTGSPTRLFKRHSPNAQVCVNVHNAVFDTYGSRELHQTVDAADLVICNCHFLAEQLSQRLHRGLEKLRVVHNGVDTSRFVPRRELIPDDEVVILFVARMVPTKGADLLINAALELQRMGKRFKLRIVGSRGFSDKDPLSGYELDLRKMAEPLGSRVEFLPFMDRNKILSIYQSASVFCAPSNYDEPCTLAIPEAMSCGVPVVASRRGGIPEIGADAILYFDPPNTKDLADKLASLVDDEAARVDFGRRARARAEEMDWTIQYRVQCDALGKS